MLKPPKPTKHDVIDLINMFIGVVIVSSLLLTFYCFYIGNEHIAHIYGTFGVFSWLILTDIKTKVEEI